MHATKPNSDTEHGEMGGRLGQLLYLAGVACVVVGHDVVDRQPVAGAGAAAVAGRPVAGRRVERCLVDEQRPPRAVVASK